MYRAAFALGLCFYSFAQSADLRPQLYVLPQNREVYSPNKEIKQQFLNSEIRPTGLPTKGRYALWISDALFATSEDTEVVQTLSNGEKVKYYNIKNYINDLKIAGRSYLAFYSHMGRLPDEDRWAALQKQFRNLTLLFDADEVMAEPQRFGGYSQTPNLNGLYLMEGQKVVYRFLTNNTSAWEAQGLVPLIRDATNTFLSGGTPRVFSPSLAASGSKIPKTLWNTGKPAVFFRIGGQELNVPKEPLRYSVTKQANGASQTSPVGNPPRQVFTRFVLDTLPELVRPYRVQLVALTPTTEGLAEFRKRFPAWTFVVLDSPAARLGWYEMGAALVDAQGQIRLPFNIFPLESGNTAILENALDALRP